MQKPRGGSRALGVLAGSGVFLGGLGLALVFVRLSLDWSDSRPYEGSVTEIRYVVFAVIAVAMVAAAMVGGILVYRRVRRGGKKRRRTR